MPPIIIIDLLDSCIRSCVFSKLLVGPYVSSEYLIQLQSEYTSYDFYGCFFKPEKDLNYFRNYI